MTGTNISVSNKGGILRLFCITLLILVIVVFVSCKPKPLKCIDFEDPALGTTYHVGDTFTDSGSSITVLKFQWGNGNWTGDGFAKIDDQLLAGGTGQDININNVNLGFHIAGPLNGLKLNFGEYGGNLNININGEFKNFENFDKINGTTIGGVNVTVVNGHGNDKGSLELSGTMDKFAFEEGEFTFVVGGQELWIDDVCPSK